MKFLIADPVHNNIFSELEKLRVAYDYQPDITRAELKSSLGDYEGLIIRSKAFLDDQLLEEASKLKVVCRAGAGIDNLDEDALNQRNIYLINAPEGNRDSVAEHCTGMLLSLLHKIVQGNDEVRRFIWDREGNRGTELGNKTVGIIGYGHMGSSFSRILSAFGCKVLAYDKYKRNFSSEHVKESSLEEIHDEADVLSLHIPLTPETKFSFTESFFMKFKKPIIFLNTSRGEVVKLEVIDKCLEKNHIVAAALDVLENEKIDDLSEGQRRLMEKLIDSGRVIFTPHVAGWSEESYRKINEVIISKLKIWLNQN